MKVVLKSLSVFIISAKGYGKDRTITNPNFSDNVMNIVEYIS
jgi:hypothetical protein